MKNVFHLCKNAHYTVYSLNRKSDETLCEDINDKESDDEQCALHELKKIQQ